MTPQLRLPRTRLVSHGSKDNRASLERVAEISFTAHDLRFGLRAAGQVALRRLCAAVPWSWREAPADSVDVLYSLCVAEERSGVEHLLYCGSELLARGDDLGLVLSAFTRHAELLTAYHARDCLFVHAGVVGWRGRAIVIPGRSMTGKTTLVKALIEAGAVYYSDEFAVLDRQGQVHPYPLPLSIRGADGQPGRKIEVEALGSHAANATLPVGLVVVTRYQEGATWRPRRLSAGQALLALMDNTVAARQDPQLSMPILRAVAAAAGAIRGKRGEASAVAAVLLRSMEC